MKFKDGAQSYGLKDLRFEICGQSAHLQVYFEHGLKSEMHFFILGNTI